MVFASSIADEVVGAGYEGGSLKSSKVMSVGRSVRSRGITCITERIYSGAINYCQRFQVVLIQVS